MYYFKVQPALPFIRIDHGGVKFLVCKSTSKTSVCSSTTSSRVTVEKLIQRELRLMGCDPCGFKVVRVNEKYFKVATNNKLCKCVNGATTDEGIADTFKLLISKSGRKISDWILNLTKYD